MYGGMLGSIEVLQQLDDGRRGRLPAATVRGQAHEVECVRAGRLDAVKVPTAMVGEQQQLHDGADEGGCLPQLEEEHVCAGEAGLDGVWTGLI